MTDLFQNQQQDIDLFADEPTNRVETTQEQQDVNNSNNSNDLVSRFKVSKAATNQALGVTETISPVETLSVDDVLNPKKKSRYSIDASGHIEVDTSIKATAKDDAALMKLIREQTHQRYGVQE